ncbi:hypothetical protein GGF31_002877 [Allomyces arbusculus]|nr:hypothetical protein GGF31_002877 [Allomyces arbusculus]
MDQLWRPSASGGASSCTASVPVAEAVPLLTAHPYFPATLRLPHYVPNTLSHASILGGFAAGLAALLVSAFVVARPPRGGRLRFLWFTLNAGLHLVFEGYFVATSTTIAGSSSLLAQMWKEYALGDSRYLANDPAVVAAEALTVVVLGPLAVACAVAIARGRSIQWPLQLVISSMHLFSCAMYMVMGLAGDAAHSRPEPIYFWGYMVAMNLPWIVVPLALISQGARHIAHHIPASAAPGSTPTKKKTKTD